MSPQLGANRIGSSRTRFDEDSHSGASMGLATFDFSCPDFPSTLLSEFAVLVILHTSATDIGVTRDGTPVSLAVQSCLVSMMSGLSIRDFARFDQLDSIEQRVASEDPLAVLVVSMRDDSTLADSECEENKLSECSKDVRSVWELDARFLWDCRPNFGLWIFRLNCRQALFVTSEKRDRADEPRGLILRSFSEFFTSNFAIFPDEDKSTADDVFTEDLTSASAHSSCSAGVCTAMQVGPLEPACDSHTENCFSKSRKTNSKEAKIES